MTKAIIFKEEFSNPAIWDSIIRNLGLSKDTDEITVKVVSSSSEFKQKKLKKGKKNAVINSRN